MSELSLTNNDIHKIIDDAMEKRDRKVHIMIYNTSVSVSISPSDGGEGMRWIEENGGFRCSDCGNISGFPQTYCPDCGAQRTMIVHKRKGE